AGAERAAHGAVSRAGRVASVGAGVRPGRARRVRPGAQRARCEERDHVRGHDPDRHDHAARRRARHRVGRPVRTRPAAAAAARRARDVLMAIDAAALFEQHHASLLRYLVRLTGDVDLAHDAAQEAFARLVLRPPRDEEPRAWLFTVATNAVRTWANTNRRRTALLE